ncbi:uncharacterized protein LOC123022705 [Varanus komodoensis]|uniref:uncharacterized protein LOC123022705 n=1 Tax=Varanus komodoensis TaxID=61221 RepID=UPI001CF7B945|nr:uncharacterized protein LOC123022705 [Varanus komodoensis]
MRRKPPLGGGSKRRPRWLSALGGGACHVTRTGEGEARLSNKLPRLPRNAHGSATRVFPSRARRRSRGAAAAAERGTRVSPDAAPPARGRRPGTSAGLVGPRRDPRLSAACQRSRSAQPRANRSSHACLPPSAAHPEIRFLSHRGTCLHTVPSATRAEPLPWPPSRVPPATYNESGLLSTHNLLSQGFLSHTGSAMVSSGAQELSIQFSRQHGQFAACEWPVTSKSQAKPVASPPSDEWLGMTQCSSMQSSDLSCRGICKGAHLGNASNVAKWPSQHFFILQSILSSQFFFFNGSPPSTGERGTNGRVGF